jgi:hypothetical protein
MGSQVQQTRRDEVMCCCVREGLGDACKEELVIWLDDATVALSPCVRPRCNDCSVDRGGNLGLPDAVSFHKILHHLIQTIVNPSVVGKAGNSARGVPLALERACSLCKNDGVSRSCLTGTGDMNRIHVVFALRNPL